MPGEAAAVVAADGSLRAGVNLGYDAGTYEWLTAVLVTPRDNLTEVAEVSSPDRAVGIACTISGGHLASLGATILAAASGQKDADIPIKASVGTLLAGGIAPVGVGILYLVWPSAREVIVPAAGSPPASAP